MTPLAQVVADTLARHGLTGPGVIAVSGGPDSVALSHLAHEACGGQIVLAHLNHQLRGEESDGDEAFVRELAGVLGVTVECERINVRSRGGNLEDAARGVRYAWLDGVARRHAARWIATGHTADDQAETVLHHFLRGSGLAGLSGIAECSRRESDLSLVRPLLGVRRAAILAFLGDKPFRVDSSNADLSFTRNRLRHEILPLLEWTINPGLVDVLTRTASQAAECQTAVTQIARTHLADAERPRAGEMLVFARGVLQTIGDFWVREVFRLVWLREGWPMGEMNATDWRRLNDIVAGSLTAHDFPGGVRVRGTMHVVQITSFPGSAWERTARTAPAVRD